MRALTLTCFFVVIVLHLSSSQVPQRLQIPGAVLLQQPRPRVRLQRPSPDSFPLPRARKPIPNAIPAPLPIRESVRPVVEEELPEENSAFDNEVAKLGFPASQSEEEETEIPSKPVPFRPERPLPVLRSDIRESQPKPRPIPIANARPLPIQNARPAPIQNARPISRPAPVLRQELPEEPAPIRRPPQQQVRQQAPVRQAARAPSRPQYAEDDEDRRRRKPEVQILRKYRTDNEDGSITWGFENDDGTFKEENLGSDCITRGKYGYIDPDGVRREYKYETGNKCPGGREQLPEELPEEPIAPKILPRRPY